MHYEILDKKRLNLLPYFKSFKEDFYLAGGTALALEIGHRDSIDFDFFTLKEFDTFKLYEKLKKIFKGFKIQKIQEEKNTLGILIDGVKISFMTYEYKQLRKMLEEENLFLASIEDIACMKVSAVLGRATNKDYVDLYFISQEIGFTKIIELFIKKHKEVDVNLVQKSLVYFEDIEDEPIMFKNNQEISFDKVKSYFIEKIKEINKK